MAFGEPGEPVAADDEHIADPAVAQLGAHPGPELRALGCLDPDPEHVFGPVEVHTHGEIRRAVADLVAVADLHHQRIEVDDRVDLLQRPRLPGLDLLKHRVGDLRDGLVRQLGADRAGQMMANVAHRHPTRIQRDDHIVEAAGAPGALRNQPRLKATQPVSRYVQPNVADLGGHGLRCAAVARVRAATPGRVALLVTQVLGLLGGQAPFEHRLDQLGQKSARPGQPQPLPVDLIHHPVQQTGVEHLIDRLPGRGRRLHTRHTHGVAPLLIFSHCHAAYSYQ